jgi:Phage integrase family
MPDGSPIHPQRISAWFLQHTRAAGLPRIRLHDVRHSYASAALAAGVPPKVISQRLGHATIAMDTYSHVIPGLDEQAAETVARLILGDGEVTTDLSANKPLATAHTPADMKGGEAQKSCSGGVSEGGLEPPRPMRALGPQPPNSRSLGLLRVYSCCRGRR